MKRELLDILACPACRSEFELKGRVEENGEILKGVLICGGCKREFPIAGGIPRIVTGLEQKSTAERFGYEWQRFPQLSRFYEQQFLDWIGPVDKDFFRGKVVLDAGCGKGRHVRMASQFGAKMVVGVDVSGAVDVACENTRGLPNVHLIQADICRPPLKQVFDYIYSVGVLHHLPEPEDGFKALVALLGSGGTISVWTYGREGNGWIIYFVNPLRKLVTAKMSLPVLRAVTLPLSLSLYWVCKLLYRPVNVFLGPAANFLPYNSYLFYISNFDLREIHSIVFDHLLAPIAFYLRKEQLLGWFERFPFVDIRIAWHNKNSWRATGRLG